MKRRKDRRMLLITRDADDAGEVHLVHCEIPSVPQTITLNIRRGQQIVIEIAPDNTRQPLKKVRK